MDRQDFINVYMDKRGLWTSALFREGLEVASLGGSYPMANAAVLDSKKKWGLNLSVIITYEK